MNRRGMVMVLSLGTLVFISAVGATMLMRSLNEAQLSRRSAARQSAFHLADAAIDQAARNLKTPTDTSDDVTSRTMETGTFQLDTPVPDPNNAQVYRVTVHGTSSGETRDLEAVFQLLPKSVFQFALFGSQTVSVSGNATTDSYDSRNGAYHAGAAGHDGDIGTNSTATGGVAVSGSIFVDGQVAVGSGATNPTSVVTGYNPAFITGGTSPPSDTQDVVAQSQNFPMPDVTIPSGCETTLPSSVHNVRTFVSGVTYCPPGDMTVNGNDTFTATGPVKIYLAGQLIVNGNATIGVASQPTWMQFLVSSTGSATLTDTITGSTLFYGTMYAPKATVNISGNAQLYGSIIAKTVNITGSAEIHYDEAATQITDTANLYQAKLVAWQELN